MGVGIIASACNIQKVSRLIRGMLYSKPLINCYRFSRSKSSTFRRIKTIEKIRDKIDQMLESSCAQL